MDRKRLSGREFKSRLTELLKSNNPERVINEIKGYQARKVISPLFSFLYNRDTNVKWNSVIAMGAVVNRLAEEEIESARNVMRRLMWNLNDESGGIGWGSPEAMGEILACNKTLANEYTPILISYARPDGNFQEHEFMQRGVLWGIGRLAGVYPDHVKGSVSDIIYFIESPDAIVRGLSAWITGLVGTYHDLFSLRRLVNDMEEIQVYMERRIKTCRVRDLVLEAIARLESKQSE